MKKRTFRFALLFVAVAGALCIDSATSGAVEKLAVWKPPGTRKLAGHEGSIRAAAGPPTASFDSPGPLSGASTSGVTAPANAHQFKIQDPAGGFSRVQLTADRPESRWTFADFDQVDRAPRFQALGGQDSQWESRMDSGMAHLRSRFLYRVAESGIHDAARL